FPAVREGKPHRGDHAHQLVEEDGRAVLGNQVNLKPVELGDALLALQLDHGKELLELRVEGECDFQGPRRLTVAAGRRSGAVPGCRSWRCHGFSPPSRTATGGTGVPCRPVREPRAECPMDSWIFLSLAFALDGGLRQFESLWGSRGRWRPHVP